MQEKRQNIRVEKTLVLQYAQTTAEPLRWDSTTIKNISCEGLLFNSSKFFAKNEILQLRLIMPTDPANRLEVLGQVVESFMQGHRTRIKFLNLSVSVKKTISDYVEYALRKPE